MVVLSRKIPIQIVTMTAMRNDEKIPMPEEWNPHVSMPPSITNSPVVKLSTLVIR